MTVSRLLYQVISVLSAIYQTYAITDSDGNGFMLATGSGQGRVFQIDLSTGNVIRNISTQVSTGVMYDDVREVAYRAQYFNRSIVKFSLTRFQREVKYSTGNGQPEHVAIDFSSGNVYYSAIVSSDSTIETSFISVIRPSLGKQRKLIKGLNLPRAIALYPSKGIMFWSDYGDDIIARTSMDGTNLEMILVNVQCVGLSIDYTTNMLYIGDFRNGEVRVTDFDGNNNRVLIRGDRNIEDVLLNGIYVYYTRRTNSPAIVRALKVSGDNVTFMYSRRDIGRIQSIDIVPRDVQPINSPCADRNGLCSTFCLPTPTGRTCACEDGQTLMSDGITCEGERCPITIPNGNLSFTCISFPGEKCSFTCNEGFYKLSVQNISCTSTGDWSPDVTTLCVAMSTGNRQNITSGTSSAAISSVLTVGLAITTVLLVAIIIGVIIFILRRRRASRPKNKSNVKCDQKRKANNNQPSMDGTAIYTTLVEEIDISQRYDELQNTDSSTYIDKFDSGENYYSTVE